MLSWFLGWIEDEVARGKRFLPDQTIQVGWSILKVLKREDGTLGFLEPNFRSMPVKFVDSVSTTLLHLLIQKSVAESLGVEAELAIPSLRDSATVCTGFGSTSGFIMSRIETKPGDSGWFFGCNNPDHNHQSPDVLRSISVYEAATLNDERVIQFLGLPQDTFIGVGDGAPCFFRGEVELSIRPGSYLHKKYVEKIT